MLAAFAAKYGDSQEKLAPPKKKKKTGEEEEVPPTFAPASEDQQRAGPSGESADPEKDGDLNATVELFLEVWEMDADAAAVNVRAANSEDEGPVFSFRPPLPAVWPPGHNKEVIEAADSGAAVPIFSFQPPLKAVWPPEHHEEVEVEPREEETQNALAPPPIAAPQAPQGPQALHPMVPLLPQPPVLPSRPPRGPLPPLPDLVVGERRAGPPIRVAGPRANRVRAPPPDPVNFQGGRIGRPGTGSRATLERRQRRERSQRMAAGSRQEQ